MKISFVPAARDYVNVMVYARNRMKNDLRQRASTMYKILIGVPFILLFFIPALLFVANHPTGTNLYISYLLVIVTFVMYAAYLYQKKIILKDIDASLSADLETIEISDRGIQASNQSETSFTSWAIIQEITENKDYILFNLPVYKSMFIPKSAFETTEHAAKFIQTAKDYMNSFNEALHGIGVVPTPPHEL
jgi:hypothetical protein